MKYPEEQIEKFLKEVGDLTKKYGLFFRGSIDAEMWTEETLVEWDQDKQVYAYKYDVDNQGESEHGWKEVKPLHACEHQWEYKWGNDEGEFARFCETCKHFEMKGNPDEQTKIEIENWYKSKVTELLK